MEYLGFDKFLAGCDLITLIACLGCVSTLPKKPRRHTKTHKHTRTLIVSYKIIPLLPRICISKVAELNIVLTLIFALLALVIFYSSPKVVNIEHLHEGLWWENYDIIHGRFCLWIIGIIRVDKCNPRWILNLFNLSFMCQFGMSTFAIYFKPTTTTTRPYHFH